MTVDLEKVILFTGANAFKNTGVYDTSITMTGTITAGQTRTFTSVVTLDENQDFAYAIANYVEFIKGGSAAYQVLPTFDAYVVTTPTGFINTALYFTINGSTVTFTAAINNPYGGTETIADTTINIRYVTYTLAN